SATAGRTSATRPPATARRRDGSSRGTPEARGTSPARPPSPAAAAARRPRGSRSQGHGDHVRAFLDRPQDPFEDPVRRAAALVIEDLPDQQLGIAGHADPEPVDVLTGHGPGDVRPVPLLIAVALTGEVLLCDLHALERGVSGVDARIEDGYLDAL